MVFLPGCEEWLGMDATEEVCALIACCCCCCCSCCWCCCCLLLQVVQHVPLGLPPGPVALVTLKGRLVLLHGAGVAVFNISHPLKLAGSQLVSHTWDDLWSLYGLRTQWQQQQQHVEQDVRGPAEQQQQPILLRAAWNAGVSQLPSGGLNTLLLLPFGSSGVAAFVPGAGAAGSSIFGSAAAATADASSDSSGGLPVDWVKMLQPVVVVMMIVVGMWQFMRASNNNSIRRASAAARGELYGSDFGSGLAGMSPEDLGQMGLWGSRALDRDFGDYGGRRGGSVGRQRGSSSSNRTMVPDTAGSLFDSGYAGLNAAGARRRARAVMLGRDRHQPAAAAAISSTPGGLERSAGQQPTRPDVHTALAAELMGHSHTVSSSTSNSNSRQTQQWIVMDEATPGLGTDEAEGAPLHGVDEDISNSMVGGVSRVMWQEDSSAASGAVEAAAGVAAAAEELGLSSSGGAVTGCAEPRRVSGAARHHVRFSTEYEVLGEDDIGRVPLTAGRYEEADEPQQLQQGLQESPVGRSSTPDSDISALESGELLTSSAGAGHAADADADAVADAMAAESFENVEQEFICKDACNAEADLAIATPLKD